MRRVECSRCQSTGREVQVASARGVDRFVQTFDCGTTVDSRGRVARTTACSTIAELRKRLRLTQSGHANSPVREDVVALTGYVHTLKGINRFLRGAYHAEQDRSLRLTKVLLKHGIPPSEW